jgi:hypothetical protein
MGHPHCLPGREDQYRPLPPAFRPRTPKAAEIDKTEHRRLIESGIPAHPMPAYGNTTDNGAAQAQVDGREVGIVRE